MGPRIWVVVPFSRPENKTNVLDNFARQSYGDKKLVIAENGGGISTFTDDSEYDHILLSPAHQSHAKNRAIEFLQKEYPDDYWACMDDDDYYGPEYLQEHADKAERGVILGKRNAWVQFDSGLVYFGGSWKEGDPSDSFVGGTMGSYLSDAQEFPIRCAEEHGFCEAARNKELTTRLLSPLHFCYNRLGSPSDHAYQASEEKLWRHSGGKGVRVLGSKEDWASGPPPSDEPKEYWESAQ